ncbi:MAG: hypothetical protein ACI93R_002385 [Flavobacteriales bacterium]
MKKLLLSTVLCLPFLTSCDAGYDTTGTDSDTDDDTTSDELFAGPSDGFSWALSLDDDGNSFVLTKKVTPSSTANTARMTGSFRDDDEFFVLSISSALPSTVTSATITGIKISDDIIVLSSFDSALNGETLALIENADCPSSDLSLGWQTLQSEADTESDEIGFYGNFTYTQGNTTASLGAQHPLNDATISLNATSTSDLECADGVAEHDDGDHYLSSSAVAIVEQLGTNYRRHIAFAHDDIDAVANLDDDYFGIMRDKEPDDNLLIKLACSAGECTLSEVIDHEDTSTLTDRYTLSFTEDDIDEPGDGFLTATLTVIDNVVTNPPSAKASCMANVDFPTSSSATLKVLSCVAQAPDDNTKLLSFIVKTD